MNDRKRNKANIYRLPAALLSLLLAALLLLCGCYNDYIVPRETVEPQIPEPTAAPTPEAVSSGGTLSVAMLGSADEYNPLRTLSEDVINTASLFFEPLVSLGTSMEPTGVLAEDWRSDDGINWTFVLKKDVYFHDGSEFTGADVAATVETIRTAGGAYTDCVAEIASCTYDADNVYFVLSEPDGLFPWKLFFPILKAGETEAAFPAGTGLFRLASREKGRLVFERNTEHAGGVSVIDGVELLFYTTVEEKAVSGADILLLADDAAVKYGSQLGYTSRSYDSTSMVCMVPYVYTGKKTEYKVSDKQKITQLPTKRVEVLSENMRRALLLTVDRDRTVERTVSGLGKAYDWPGMDNCIFRKNAEIPTPSDTQAEKLLALEGYTHKGGNTNWFKADDTDQSKPLTLCFLANSEDVELIHACDSIVSRLKAIGIKSTVKVASGGEFTALFLSGEYDYTFLRLSMSFAPDLLGMFANDSIFNYNGCDTEWYRSRLLELKRGWRQTGSGAEACLAYAAEYAAGLQEIYARFEQELPFVGLYVRRNVMLFSSRLGISDSAGTDAWNLFADAGNWYIV